MKGCLKIALFVLHTRLVYLMKLGVCVQRMITDLSSLIHKRVQELFYRALCWVSDNDNQHLSPLSVQHVFTMRVPHSFVLYLFVN